RAQGIINSSRVLSWIKVNQAVGFLAGFGGVAGPPELTAHLTLSHGLPHGLKIKKGPSLLGPHGFTAPAPWKAPPPLLPAASPERFRELTAVYRPPRELGRLALRNGARSWAAPEPISSRSVADMRNWKPCF